ncbi:MAG: methyltransferase [Nanoarchaeota archaeon]|mgnify:CR=1 FL=1
MSHYFSQTQESAFKLSTIKDTVRGVRLELSIAPGVFSAKRIDFGSKLLAEKMIIGTNDSVLDLGCGIGIVGIVAAHLTENEVVLTDVNERACKLAEMNSRKIKNITVVCGYMYEKVKQRKFDVILLNPPQTAGKKICFEMIERAKDHLNPNGTLQIVARHNKGGETLSLKMKEVFGNAKDIAKSGGYRVYISQKAL